MSKVCSYVINILLLNWGLEGKERKNTGLAAWGLPSSFAMFAISLEYRVWSLWFGVWGLKFRVWGLEFRVWGLGFEA